MKNNKKEKLKGLKETIKKELKYLKEQIGTNCPTYPMQNYGIQPPPFMDVGSSPNQILTCTLDQSYGPQNPLIAGTPSTPDMAYCSDPNALGCTYQYNNSNWQPYTGSPISTSPYCWDGTHTVPPPPFMIAGNYDQEIVQHTDGYQYLWCMGASAWIVQNYPACNAECTTGAAVTPINTNNPTSAIKPIRTKGDNVMQNRFKTLANIKPKQKR